MTAAETRALRDRVRTHAQLAAATFVTTDQDPGADPDAPRTLTAPPYVLIYPGGGVDGQDRVTGPYTDRDPSFSLHCVGESALAAEIVADWVDAVLRPGGRGVRLDVPGRRIGALRRVDVGPALDDDSTRPVVWYVPVIYRFRSQPGPVPT